MAREIADRLRRALRFDIARRGDHDRLERRGEADRDHVLRDHAAETHAGVETAGDNIGQGVVAGDLDDKIGIAPGEFRQHRRDRDRQGDARRVEPQQPGHLPARRAQPFDRLLDFVQRRTDRRDEARARLGQRDAARGARKQRRAEPVLDRFDGMADRRRAHAEFGRRRAEAAAARDGENDGQMSEQIAIHS